MVRLAITVAMSALLFSEPARAGPRWDGAGGAIFVLPAEHRGEPADDAPARAPAPVQPFEAAVDAAAARHGLNPKLLHALVIVESAYRPRAISPAGAMGLTQLMPSTARELGVPDALDPGANLQGGADYLARQLIRFGDLRLALAAYNSGPTRVAAVGRVPSIPETQAYVRAVVECFLALTAGRSARSAGECRTSGDTP